MMKKCVVFVASVLALLLAAPLHAATLQMTAHSSPDLTAFAVIAGVALMLGAALGTTNLTMLDRQKRMDPNGQTARIIELLAQTNEMMDDMVVMEGNLPTGHLTTVRTGLPSTAWRLINGGVAPSKSTTAQITEHCGMLEAWSEVDPKLAKISGDVGAFRLSEATAFLEAMNQEMQQTVIYGNGGTAPEEFTGLAARYSSTSAGNGDNVILAGGAGGDNTSIWLVAWGEESICGIYPKGSSAGLQREDKGEQVVYFGNGLGQTRMVALQERYTWDCGIAVKDWRYAVRIANIDVSDLAGGSAADLIDAMEHAEEILPNNYGRRAFYMNRTVRRYLRKQTRADVSAGGGLNYENVNGKRVYYFGATPVRTVDAILNTEATIS